TGREILDLFRDLHNHGNSIIIVTHEDDVAREAARVIHIRDGRTQDSGLEMFIENLKIALRAISANKLRSILTVLGVMIGVAAVIAVVSLVQGMQYQISAQLENVGATFVRVAPDFSGMQKNPFLPVPSLTYEDAVAVQRGATA